MHSGVVVDFEGQNAQNSRKIVHWNEINGVATRDMVSSQQKPQKQQQAHTCVYP